MIGDDMLVLALCGFVVLLVLGLAWDVLRPYDPPEVEDPEGATILRFVLVEGASLKVRAASPVLGRVASIGWSPQYPSRLCVVTEREWYYVYFDGLGPTEPVQSPDGGCVEDGASGGPARGDASLDYVQPFGSVE